MIRLTVEPIDIQSVIGSVRSRNAGAVVLFLGTVREVTGDRKTAALYYEAYPDMALAQMAELEREARTRWPLEGASLVHRLGRLEPDEISVAVAVSTPHRKEAFEAGQFLIDRLKACVPIWKKEEWSDGTADWIHPGPSDLPGGSSHPSSAIIEQPN